MVGLGSIGGNGSSVDRVVGSFLRAGAAMPLLKEILEFWKIKTLDTVHKVMSHIPGL